MKISTTTFDRLTPEQLAAWRDWQQQDPLLASPYFHPEFTRLASAVRAGVEIALIEEDGELAGLLPFERRGRIGVPVAKPLSDFQAVIGRPGLVVDARSLVCGCGLAALEFDHLLVAQGNFAQHQHHVAPSPYLDLSEGFEAYEKARAYAGCIEMGQARKKIRKLENQVGPVRFVNHTDADGAFQTLLNWKSQQYVRTQVTDLFSFPWIVEFLDHIRHASCDGFAGVFSVMYVGEKIAALHLGMRGRNVLHAWFPAYDAELAKYSPGTILYAEMARAAPGMGIHRIDLGKGPETYKLGLMSGSMPVAEASIESSRLVWAFAAARRGAREFAQNRVLGAPLRAAARISRSLRRRLNFQ